MFPLGYSDVTIILRMPCLLLGIQRTKLSFLFPLTRSQFFGALFIACFRKNGKINKTQFHHEKRNGVHLSASKIGRVECLIFETFQLLNLKEDRKCTYNFVSNLSINLSCQIDDLYLCTQTTSISNYFRKHSSFYGKMRPISHTLLTFNVMKNVHRYMQELLQYKNFKKGRCAALGSSILVPALLLSHLRKNLSTSLHLLDLIVILRVHTYIRTILQRG